MKFSFDRRRMLKALAAIPCAVAAYFVYEELTEDDGVIRTTGAPEIPTAKRVSYSAGESSYCFFALGDTGLASTNREAVIRQMLVQAKRMAPDSIFLVGDNFYEKGVTSVDDPLWQTHFEDPFSADRFDMPFYSCLGNHDYFGSIGAQVEYSLQHPRWKMPATYYSFEQKIDTNCNLQFFVLDTTPIEEGDYTTTTQIKWLREKLKNSRAQYKIVIGHHPLFSGGEHGPSRRNYRHLVNIFDEFGIDLYICGHDHDLQLHDTKRGWLHLVSGAGSKIRSVKWVDTTMFAQASSGFSKILLTPNRLAIEIYSTDRLLFSHEKHRKTLLADSGRQRIG